MSGVGKQLLVSTKGVVDGTVENRGKDERKERLCFIKNSISDYIFHTCPYYRLLSGKENIV